MGEVPVKYPDPSTLATNLSEPTFSAAGAGFPSLTPKRLPAPSAADSLTEQRREGAIRAQEVRARLAEGRT